MRRRCAQETTTFAFCARTGREQIKIVREKTQDTRYYVYSLNSARAEFCFLLLGSRKAHSSIHIPKEPRLDAQTIQWCLIRKSARFVAPEAASAGVNKSLDGSLLSGVPPPVGLSVGKSVGDCVTIMLSIRVGVIVAEAVEGAKDGNNFASFAGAIVLGDTVGTMVGAIVNTGGVGARVGETVNSSWRQVDASKS